MLLYKVFRAGFRVIFKTVFRWQIYGLDNIPAEGPTILCSNHLSNWDPPLIGSPLVRPVHYMAKEELFRVPVLGWLIRQFGAFPVKRGGVSKESIRLSISLLREGKVMGVFPEGTRKNAGGEGKKGAAMLALRSGATVIPVAIVGNYKPFHAIRVYYGKPVDLSEFTGGGSEVLEAATEKIMETIREMVRKETAKEID